MSRTAAIASIVVASIVLAGAGSVGAEVRGNSVTGSAYVTGGVTVGELRKLEREKDRYTLWITTAAKGSGAHLSDAKVRIADANKQVVLETTMIGPWLMIDLPLGTYAIDAVFKEQTQKRTTRIHAGDHHQVIFYFESPAEVSPDWVSPFKDSPYSGK